ncbi:adipocyte plasma membrane-associated protein Hemomucin-like [Cataglyphis hispanica]|uniref:adipocyte plasma membrane-associated protein Hemomucin-like n=1 Tax=Cataglyphis hispanica TaxID=1086592 RepID=UPI00217FEDB7|nr:adipocyte plasma membrane-associated protein Hemomucin-like [Cataglyphis hispanica]
MWKLLWVAILVAVLTTYANANHEKNKRAIKNNYQIPNLLPPIHSSLKGQEDAIVIESNFPGYEYTTPKPIGYVYAIPNVTILTPTSTTTTTTKKPFTPGNSYLPPRTTPSTTTTTTTTPSTTTTTTTTTPSTTTTTTTTPSTTTTTTLKPTYLPPYKRTYLPPPAPTREPVRPTLIPYPSVKYEPIKLSTTYRPFKSYQKPGPTPTTPRSTTHPVLIRGYEYLPPKEYLPVFETRKR